MISRLQEPPGNNKAAHGLASRQLKFDPLVNLHNQGSRLTGLRLVNRKQRCEQHVRCTVDNTGKYYF